MKITSYILVLASSVYLDFVELSSASDDSPRRSRLSRRLSGSSSSLRRWTHAHSSENEFGLEEVLALPNLDHYENARTGRRENLNPGAIYMVGEIDGWIMAHISVDGYLDKLLTWNRNSNTYQQIKIFKRNKNCVEVIENAEYEEYFGKTVGFVRDRGVDLDVFYAAKPSPPALPPPPEPEVTKKPSRSSVHPSAKK